MPLLAVPDFFIDEPVRPLRKGGILFQRVQRYLDIHPHQDPITGEMYVLLTVQVQHFLTNEDGTAGADASELVPPYPMTYAANNCEAIDLATGEIVYSYTVASDRAKFEADCAADPRPLLLRGDAYKAQMHGGPVDMLAPIREAMRAADGPPYYRFGRDEPLAPQP